MRRRRIFELDDTTAPQVYLLLLCVSECDSTNSDFSLLWLEIFRMENADVFAAHIGE